MRAPRPATLAGSASLALLLLAFAWRPELMERVELALLDWRFLVRGVVASEAPIRIVAIDARSVDEIGRWPWRRSRMAELIERISADGARVIGLDMVFSEPELSAETAPLQAARDALSQRAADEAVVAQLDRALHEADTDARLAAALEQSDRVVLGYFFRTEPHERPVVLAAEVERALRSSRVSVSRVPQDSRAPVLQCSDAEINLPALHRSARRSGFFSADRDLDGAVRHAPLIVSCAGQFYISLPLAMAELAYGSRSLLVGNHSELQALRIDQVDVPIDERGRILVNYLGPSGSVPHVSAVDVLAGRLPPGVFEDQLVLVGVTEVGLADLQTTPFGRVFPGVEVHANVLDNLMTGRVLVHRDDLVGVELGLIAVLALLVTFAAPRLHSVWRGALLTGVLGALLFGAATWAFVAHGVWLNVAYPTATLLLTYLSVSVVTSAVHQRQGRMLRRAFATYVPPAVVDQIVKQPERLELGGERRDLSILFSDVCDFTTLSERLGASDTAKLMNTYLSEMTEILFDSGGTLDKYIGDAVVAFWGAPLEVPEHPQRAAEAALAMQRAAARLRRRGDLPGADALLAGIGLHAGEVVVGNLGSHLRFDYTITGDGVNLCSRLEGLTRNYGVDILASEDFVRRLEGCETREVDRVRVKGRREPVRIFELLDPEALGPADAAWRSHYARALEAHRAGHFEEASQLFAQTDAMRPAGDGPSRELRERAGRLREQAASEGLPAWDGVHEFHTK